MASHAQQHTGQKEAPVPNGPGANCFHQGMEGGPPLGDIAFLSYQVIAER